MGTPAHAQVVPDSTGPWVRQSWTVRDGLPVNAIGKLFQSREGYLWATTLDGLVRYDGVRFTVFNSALAPELPTNRFISGFEAPDGTLWFQTENLSLIRYRNGRFTHVDRAHGLSSTASVLAQDSEGRIWIGTGDGAGRIRGDRHEPVAPDTVPNAQSFLRRRDGTVWIGTVSSGIYRIGDGPAERVVSPSAIDSAIVWTLLEDPDGALWIGTARGLWVERNGTVSRITTGGRPSSDVFKLVWSPARSSVYLYSVEGVYRVRNDRIEPVVVRPLRPFSWNLITVDASGIVWYAAGPDLMRDGKVVYTLPTAPGAPAPPEITSLLIDREGGIWLGTQQGLERITPALFRTFSVSEGLGARNVYPVANDRGQIWAGTWGGGLSLISPEGSVTTIPPARGAPDNVHSIAVDSLGTPWIVGTSPLSVCDQRTAALHEGRASAASWHRDVRAPLRPRGTALGRHGQWHRSA